MNMTKSGILKAGEFYEGSVPAEYQQVEYIQSDGNQYLKTGVVPTLDTGYYIKFLVTTMTSNPSPMAAQTSGSDSRVGFIIGTSGENRRLWYGCNAWTQANPDVSCQINTIYDVYYNYYNSRLAIQEGIYTMSLSSRTSVAQFDLPLFTDCLNGSYTDTTVRLVGRIYRCVMTEGTTKVRDLIPCYRKSDGVIGMYDIITKNFYTNQGSGAFTKGTEIGSVQTKIYNTNKIATNNFYEY